ncbi:fungal-specific transcription factor domain-containing protein [Lipomyces kononenkoae]|uniref:Fungal-specific transcription factor domain-containing protein n=1 Tax=Lipomyces kononenkoae TaxID=34357 RepID=A0ACC3ST83_LIPKO
MPAEQQESSSIVNVSQSHSQQQQLQQQSFPQQAAYPVLAPLSHQIPSILPLSSSLPGIPVPAPAIINTGPLPQQTGALPTVGSGIQGASQALLGIQPAQKSRPCDSCRRRKSRCFIPPNDDSCVLCRFRKQECTFLEGPKPRRKRDTPSTSDGQNAPTKLTKIDGSPPATFTSPPESNVSLGSSVQVPIRETLPIEDYSTIRGHSLLKKTLGLQNPRWSTYVGSSSTLDYGFLELLPFDRRDEAELAVGVSLRKAAPDAMFIMEYDRSIDGYEEMLNTVDDIERIVAPHGQALIDLYFRIVHPSFPVLHKKVFLEKYSRTHREFAPPLLAAVYSLALNWWSYDPELAPLPKPDVEKLDKLAHKTFADVIMRPKLSTVQAGLLLLQRRHDGAGDWPLCSHVVALAEELGLGLECEKWKIPKWERGLRRRLAWAVWLQDKWHALTQSRPSHIDKRNWLVKHVTSDDFPETAADESNEDGSAEVENGRRLFQEMISLSEIVHEVLTTLFTVSAERELRDVEGILEKAKPIQIKLKDWYQSLPESLRMNTQLKTRKLSSNGSLHLAYFATEITLHRRIIHALTASTTKEIVQVCRSAARVRLLAAMDFVKSLKPEHIQAFWYSGSATNFALVGTFAALLFATATEDEERKLFKTCLDEYRWSLRVSSRGFEQMSQALRKLDLAISRIPIYEIDKRPKAREEDDDDEEDGQEEENEDDEEDESGQQPQQHDDIEAHGGQYEEDELYDLSTMRYWNETGMNIPNEMVFLMGQGGVDGNVKCSTQMASGGELRALSASGSEQSSPEQQIHHPTERRRQVPHSQLQRQQQQSQSQQDWMYLSSYSTSVQGSQEDWPARWQQGDRKTATDTVSDSALGNDGYQGDMM